MFWLTLPTSTQVISGFCTRDATPAKQSISRAEIALLARLEHLRLRVLMSVAPVPSVRTAMLALGNALNVQTRMACTVPEEFFAYGAANFGARKGWTPRRLTAATKLVTIFTRASMTRRAYYRTMDSTSHATKQRVTPRMASYVAYAYKEHMFGWETSALNVTCQIQ